MLIFLDTEFTDFLYPMLISIGMVADSGEEFYAEVPFADAACSAFVREAVIPLLNQYPHAYCPVVDLGMRITAWLKIVKRSNEDVAICIDFQTDWDLIAEALDNRVPSWCKPRHVGRNINELLRYDYHKNNALPEHHALFDAQANRYAFRERPPVTLARTSKAYRESPLCHWNIYYSPAAAQTGLFSAAVSRLKNCRIARCGRWPCSVPEYALKKHRGDPKAISCNDLH